jgi:chemotaxis protein MotB
MVDITDEEVHELVIIKHRHGHEEEDHHGGVWKIAYADFMTAMMAFFLVLWLLNSTNKEAKISIKNYFNPVKLADASMTRKGIIDPKDAQPGAAPTMGQKNKSDEPGDKHGDNGIFPQSNGPADREAKSPDPGRPEEAPKPGAGPKPGEGGKPADGGRTGTGADVDALPQPTGAASDTGTPTYSETALFQDPYRILSEIAAKGAPAAAAAPGQPDGPIPAPAYRDPFESTPAAPPPAPIRPAARPVPASPPPGAASPIPAGVKPLVATPPAPPSGKVDQQPTKPVDLAEAAKGASTEVKAEAVKLKAEIAKAMGEMGGGKDIPSIEVKATTEGVLISLTDDLDFSMFSIGSAQPQPRLIKLMEKIASLLKTRTGDIVIRGHTDARPYKSTVYDNWRLSSDRAQMARFMLIRGGLDEKRFAAVEGYADRQPKVPSDPLAAANRRIEILLRKVRE